ncbi:MAG TPA: sensor histidine kinase [Clostridia bacterium]|nr:sensor histidine kinase [Clostridia bacterium]
MKPRLGFFNRINDIPLNFKFILIYVVCILIPIISVNAVLLDRLLKVVYEREENNYRISFDRSRADIVKLLEGGVSVTHSIATDNTVYGILERSFKSQNEYYEVYVSQLRNRFDPNFAAYDYITGISLYIDNPTIVSGGVYFRLDDNVKNTSWYKKMEATRKGIMIDSYIGSTYSVPKQLIPNISIIRRVQDYPRQGSLEIMLKVDIDTEKIRSILSVEKDYIDLFIVNGDGDIICSADNEVFSYPENGFLKYNPDNGGKRLVFNEPLSDSFYLDGWKLVGIANMQLLTSAANRVVGFVILVGIISMVFSTLLVYIIVHSYNYRLKRLSRHMLRLREGQFDLIEMYEGKDEIGGVIRNFNIMAEKINALINDVYKLEIQKRDLELERVRAELNYLQSQMNPHFLFNTLNALVADCSKQNYEAVSQVLNYLAKPLRRLTSWKDDIVMIEEEIAFTEMYLKIEKYRFREKFFYNLEVDDEAKKYRIPKMSLQPLAENACKHGIQDIKGAGIVSITIAIADGQLRVSVEDNGKGMEGTKLDEVMRNIREEGEPGYNIGIRNVYRRLKLYYGDGVTFNVESRLDYGTCVSFTIPVEKLL